MINPSSNGWVEKFFSEKKTTFFESKSSLKFYENIRETGFIYGHIIQIKSFDTNDYSQWKSQEVSKVALLDVLYQTYIFFTNESDSKKFISKTIAFYELIAPKNFGFLNKIIPKSENSNLESLIDERVQTNSDTISKNFSHIVTNALLFVDVLAFEQYLKLGEIPNNYLKKIEETIIGIVSLALQIKPIKSNHDDLLIKLFEASIRFTKFSKISVQSIDALPLDFLSTDLEKFYLLDLAGLTLWNDEKVENNEIYFLQQLAEKINIEDTFVNDSIAKTHTFITTYKKEIQYFNFSNPVKHFYDQTTKGVVFLIKRNKKRLTKEISESKELMQLLAKSTRKDLDDSEKKKIKKQLLDICKTIPSLTIFLLPGGALLLPILIKFIPQLLPSAFNENFDENE
jgi:LETM1-like protein